MHNKKLRKMIVKTTAAGAVVVMMCGVVPANLGMITGSMMQVMASDYDSRVGMCIADFDKTDFYTLTPPVYNTYYPWECVWYACGRAEEKAGRVIPMIRGLGNANLWYDSVKLERGKEVRSNSIACYGSKTNNSYGHVIFIERVEGDTVYYTEANVDGGKSDNLRSPGDGVLKVTSIAGITGPENYQGCIYMQDYIDNEIDDISVYEGVDYSAVFNARYYYENNLDVAAACTANGTVDANALLAHFVNFGMSEGRKASKDFNVKDYMYDIANQDLRDAFGYDYKQYYCHYINFGVDEGRTNHNNEMIYDAQYYYDSNPDVAAACTVDGVIDYLGLFKHFVNCGMNEGRKASSTFNIQCYISNYNDLRNAFGDDNKQYYVHYSQFGNDEGRNAATYNNDMGKRKITEYNGIDYSDIYDPGYYYNNNPDVARAFGGNGYATLKHFVEYGMNEGRQAKAAEQMSDM